MDSKWRLPWKPTFNDDLSNPYLIKFLDKYPEFQKPSAHVGSLSRLMHLLDANQGMQAVKALEYDLRTLTKYLERYPYCATTWYLRGQVLLKLLFPELATGDAYKAHLLLRNSSWNTCSFGYTLESDCCSVVIDSEKLDDDIQFYYFKAQRPTNSASAIQTLTTRLLCQALFLAQSFTECVGILRTCSQECSTLKKLERLARDAKEYEDSHFHSKLNTYDTSPGMDEAQDFFEGEPGSSTWIREEETLQAKEVEEAGAVKCEPYPWLPSGCLYRPSALLRKVNQSLEACEIGPSNVRRDATFLDTTLGFTDVLGVFALRCLPKGHTFLIDKTWVCAVDDPRNSCSCCRKQLGSKIYRLPCCDAKYCGGECARLASTTYHTAICGVNLSSFEDSYRNRTRSARARADEQLFLRVLATAVSEPAKHPLQTSVVQRMTAQYYRTIPCEFTLERDVKRPFKMLQKMGIDIFANHKFDTWVLQTIQARIRTNIREEVWEGGCFVAINPQYLFFNHSCEPNVRTDLHPSDKNNKSVLHFTISKTVMADEELCISYLDYDDLEAPWLERREKLRDWTGAGCRCPRCLREENQTQNAHV